MRLAQTLEPSRTTSSLSSLCRTYKTRNAHFVPHPSSLHFPQTRLLTLLFLSTHVRSGKTLPFGSSPLWRRFQKTSANPTSKQLCTRRPLFVRKNILLCKSSFFQAYCTLPQTIGDTADLYTPREICVTHFATAWS